MGNKEKYLAFGTAVVGIACIGYALWKKKNRPKPEDKKEEKRNVEVKVEFEIPLTEDETYTPELIGKVMNDAGAYYGYDKVLQFTLALKDIVDSIETTVYSKKLSNYEANKEVGSLISPLIFMIDNKLNTKQHPVAIDIKAFEEEILPMITIKKPRFESSYNRFKELMLWEKENSFTNKRAAEPIHNPGFGFNQQLHVQ